MPLLTGPLLCLHCHEPLDGIDPGCMIGNGTQPFHVDCLFRKTVGSVGHQKGRCPCCGGSEDDPPGLTKREAAREAAAFWRLKHAEMVSGEDTVLEGDC